MTMNLGEMLHAKLANDSFEQDIKRARKLLEHDMMNKQGAAMNAGILGGVVSGQGIYATPMQPETRFDPNEHPAYQASLEALADLWRAKHGSKWVERRNFVLGDEDDFWDNAVDRLGNAGLMESVRGWMRLKD